MSSLHIYNARMPQGLGPTQDVKWQLNTIRKIAVQKHGQAIAVTVPYDFIFTYLTAGRCVCVERRGRAESLDEYIMDYMWQIEGSEVAKPRVVVKLVI